MPASVDEVFGYTAPTKDNMIDIVHCYSMRNGLYGSPKEARVFWTRLDFSNPDHMKSGSGENIRAISLPITTKIEQFAVYDTDLSVFLMG